MSLERPGVGEEFSSDEESENRSPLKRLPAFDDDVDNYVFGYTPPASAKKAVSYTNYMKIKFLITKRATGVPELAKLNRSKEQSSNCNL